MFNRDWLRDIRYLTFGLLALGLAINIVYVALLGNLEVHKEWERRHEAESQITENEAKNISVYCSGISFSPDRFIECISSKIQHFMDKKDTNQDLQAQKDMAYWAQALFLLTIFSTIFSFLGVIAVFISLRQTRDAISDTREIGEAQVRAYIRLKINDINVTPHDDGGAKVVIDAHFENSGASPAYGVRIGYNMFSVEPGEISETIHDIDKIGHVGPPHQAIPAGSDDQRVTLTRKVPDIKNRHIRFVYMIEYEDVFETVIPTPITAGTLAQSPTGNGKAVLVIDHIGAEKPEGYE